MLSHASISQRDLDRVCLVGRTRPNTVQSVFQLVENDLLFFYNYEANQNLAASRSVVLKVRFAEPRDPVGP